jgi:hypothetical protein
MKKALLLSVFLVFTLTLTHAQEKKATYDYIWLNGGVGAAGVVSTNIINSGAILPAYMEILVQQKRRRIGIGVAHELYLTPENLGKLMLGNSSNTEKVYLTWEYMLIPNFFINIGACAQFGGFLVGNDIKKANDENNKDIPNYNYFGNVGLLAEIGIKPVFIFVKPYLEYKSYTSFHKEIIAGATLGIKFKLNGDKK